MPAKVDVWLLRGSRDLPVSAAPPEATAYGVTRVWEASYAGPLPLGVTVYQVKPGTAFEVMQKWRKEAGQYPFYTKNFVVVVKPADAAAPRRALEQFSQAFEKSLQER